MKTFAAICLIAVVAFVLSCQESAATKAEREQMAAQIKTLEGKVTELGAKVEMMTAEFAKHMTDFHTKATKPAAIKPTPGKPPAGKPPRTGR
jgi:outer membrane murein-binding lipoprotein Lpp